MSNKVKNLRFNALENPKFIKPYRLNFEIDGNPRSWEVLRSFDSVSILLYHEEKEAFLLVKQSRFSFLLRDDVENIDTYEICAGIVDKDLSLEEIAKEEVLEETGYRVEKLTKITSFFTSVGFASSKQTMFFGTISSGDRVQSGGGVDEEDIEVVFVPKKEAKAFLFDERYKKTAGVMFAFYWFLSEGEACIAKP